MTNEYLRGAVDASFIIVKSLDNDRKMQESVAECIFALYGDELDLIMKNEPESQLSVKIRYLDTFINPQTKLKEVAVAEFKQCFGLETTVSFKRKAGNNVVAIINGKKKYFIKQVEDWKCIYMYKVLEIVGLAPSNFYIATERDENEPGAQLYICVEECSCTSHDENNDKELFIIQFIEILLELTNIHNNPYNFGFGVGYGFPPVENKLVVMNFDTNEEQSDDTESLIAELINSSTLSEETCLQLIKQTLRRYDFVKALDDAHRLIPYNNVDEYLRRVRNVREIYLGE